MTKTTTGLMIVACSLFTIATANACEPMHSGMMGTKLFAEIDTNKDGVISKKEFDTFQNKRYKEMDTNHDGKITIEEFEDASAPMQGDHCDHPAHGFGSHHGYDEESGDEMIHKRFEAADTNHDGALSREEAKSTPMILQHFDEIDTNKDGKVTEEELKSMMDGQDAAPKKAESMPEKNN